LPEEVLPTSVLDEPVAQPETRVNVGIDEARRDDLFAGVDRAVHGAVEGLPDRDDAVAAASRFREDTRELRVRLAAELERRYRRKVSWGVEVAGERLLFTSLTVPVMTRLRLPERHVLDTLIDAGVARSRSDALAWCVRLVGSHQADWIRELREALVKVGELRRRGPV
jgi:hypothetical protein